MFNHRNVCKGFSIKIISKLIQDHDMNAWTHAWYYFGDVRFSESKKYIIGHNWIKGIKIKKVTIKINESTA